ncbi:MAG TPA: hypothetical protein DCL38_01190 [Lachnospiraceae bacterium]|nr:hypothetical protein [Lachnospiraceae bacterium]
MTEKNRIDDELMETVSGGTDINMPSVFENGGGRVIQRKCENCSQHDELRTFDCYSGGRAICRECGYEIRI